MEYQSYLNRLQKKGSKPHKISHCLGVRDAWKWVRRNKWTATHSKRYSQQLYSQIIDRVNKLIVDKILEGHEIEFPYQMGSILICSIPAKVASEGGKIKNNYKVDWKRTLRLWYEDKEAEAEHLIVKRIQRNIYFIKYSKKNASYTNKRLYAFRANRSLCKLLGNAVETGIVKAMPIDN